MMNLYETPPVLKGTPEQQLSQLYSYLYRLSEALNVASNTISSMQTQQIIQEIKNAPGSIMPNAETIEDVKALINKTAKELFDGLEELDSVVGAYTSDITTTIEETTGAMLTRYGIVENITELQALSAGFSSYMMETGGFIKTGFVTRDDEGVPIIGIAIGQGLTSQSVTDEDGNTYEAIDPTQSCAFYTADKVSFRVNGREAAYVSNRKLYIGDVEISGGTVTGENWFINTTDGFSIEWIGGD